MLDYSLSIVSYFVIVFKGVISWLYQQPVSCDPFLASKVGSTFSIPSVPLERVNAGIWYTDFHGKNLIDYLIEV